MLPNWDVPISVAEVDGRGEGKFGKTVLTSFMVVILNDGHFIDRFRVDRSSMTRLLFVFFFGTENRGP